LPHLEFPGFLVIIVIVYLEQKQIHYLKSL